MNTNPNGNTNPEIVDEDVLVDVAEDATQEEKDEALAKLQDTNKQLYARAKKAEGFEQVDGKWVKKAKPADEPKPETKEKKPEENHTTSKEKLTQTDLIAIVKADIPEEDLDEIIDYAKLKKISVKDALKTPLIVGMLAEKKEQRATAESTNTNGGRRGSSKVSDSELIENARKGVFPESDEDVARLVRLKRANR